MDPSERLPTEVVRDAPGVGGADAPPGKGGEYAPFADAQVPGESSKAIAVLDEQVAHLGVGIRGQFLGYGIAPLVAASGAFG